MIDGYFEALFLKSVKTCVLHKWVLPCTDLRLNQQFPSPAVFQELPESSSRLLLCFIILSSFKISTV